MVKPLISFALKTSIATVTIGLVFSGGSPASGRALADESPTHSSEAHEQETQASLGQEQEQEDTTFEPLSQPNKSLSPNHFIPLHKMIGDLSRDVRLVNAKLEPWSEYEKELGGAIYNFVAKDRMIWVVQVGHLKKVSYG